MYCNSVYIERWRRKLTSVKMEYQSTYNSNSSNEYNPYDYPIYSDQLINKGYQTTTTHQSTSHQPQESLNGYQPTSPCQLGEKEESAGQTIISWDNFKKKPYIQCSHFVYWIRSADEIEILPFETGHVRTSIIFSQENSSLFSSSVKNMEQGDHWLTKVISDYYFVREGLISPLYTGRLSVVVCNLRDTTTKIRKNACVGKLMIERCQYHTPTEI